MDKSQNNKTNIKVGLENRTYDIFVAQNILEDCATLVKPFLSRNKIHIMADENALKFHGDKIINSIKNEKIEINLIEIPSGENSKSFATFENSIEKLLSNGIERGDLLIAFGGGVVGDLTGFVAGVVNRGIDFIQIPTTLLSQVDSSVGGKTAINAKAGKNLVGLFWQPKMVIIDTNCLNTLDKRDILAGFAEIFKIGLIHNLEFFEFCENNFEQIINNNASERRLAIETSIKAKAQIVAIDERESGIRALLNLGHTFAHAIEASVNYDEKLWRHGEAVACGIVMAAKFSNQIGVLDEVQALRIENFIKNCGYKTNIANENFNPQQMLETMQHDKKNAGGQINLILLKDIGNAYVHKNAPIDELNKFLENECKG